MTAAYAHSAGHDLDGHDHGSGDDHVHEHDGAHNLEGYHVKGGAPALDIGGDIGAMVVLMNRSALGTELHLRSTDDPLVRVHTGVWEREQGGGTIVAAVFAELAEGAYDVLDDSGAPSRRIQIVGGRVTDLDLSS